MKLFFGLIALFILQSSFAQSTIKGSITHQGKAIANANIYLQNTYDGASSKQNGFFEFSTQEVGTQLLIVEAIGFELYEEEINTTESVSNLSIELLEILSLDEAVITAGKAISTSESEQSTLDIVTTAGSMGDPLSALTLAPGTQNVAEDGRLFVRGGDPTETNIYIDKMLVFQPYSPIAPNTPTRGRFSPFLFKGINFNTGAYGANNGNALSGVLAYETIDFPTENSVDLNLFTLGLQAAVKKKWDKDALTINASYFNLALYNQVFNTRDEWLNPIESIASEGVYRHKMKRGILKSYFSYDYTDFHLISQDINTPNGSNFKLKNANYYWNSTLDLELSKNTDFFIGKSVGFTASEIAPEGNWIDNQQIGLNLRAEIKHKINRQLSLNSGLDLVMEEAKNQYKFNGSDSFMAQANNHNYAAFTQLDYYPISRLGISAGLRYTYSTALNQYQINPRLAAGYKFGKHNLSFAAGQYTQVPNLSILEQTTNVNYTKSNQYVFNYNYKNNNESLRLELYHKAYTDLVRYKTNDFLLNNIDNSGNGFAKGVDLFYRNKNGHIKNLEYWITYSYIDSERLHLNFPTQAQPNFIANHKFTAVSKYWLSDWRSMISLTYSFGSGRPYTNPNTTEFLSERTKSFNQIDFSWAYLIDQQKILFVGINNLTNFKNVFGYDYSNFPDENNFYNRQAITPQNNQFFLVGFLWTISTNKTRNQLDNL